MTSEEDKISYPEPYKVLTEKPSIKKYLKYLMFVGPGAIVASMTIGQGQLIIGPQIGAWAGFALLWLITLNIGSYIIAYISCRFTLLSGIGLMDLFAIKTKKGWFNWLIIGIMLIFIPVFTATIITSLGQALCWVFGVGHYLIWGISFCLLAGALALAGRYKIVEYSQAFFIVVLAVGAVVSVILIKPDILEILPNFFTIGQNVPADYPSWVIEEFPAVAKTPIPLVMLGYLGTLTITLVTLIGYLGWIKVKKWGIFKDRKDPNAFSQKCFDDFRKKGKITYLPDGSKEVKKSRLLLKPIIIDMSVAFIVVSIVSAAYMIAGKYLLGLQPDGNYLLPSNIDLITQQAVIFSNIAPWLEPLFKISVVFALFGTAYAGFEAATRMLYETGKNINKVVKNLEYKRFMFYLLTYLLILGIPLSILMYRGLSVLLMLSITLLFLGVIGVMLYGIGVIYLSQKFLPKEYKLGKLSLSLAIVAIVFMSIPLLFLFIR
ncbi:MAG: Nramp family divalent metal transporter [Candidatus Thermoplasmatota archaeon]|nr:Nramp family divalent metal transporter [Candidatus Thermoplasmatota archaeon]